VRQHWAAAYVGTPYRPGETDCWNFARRVWREVFGLDIPAAGVDVGDQRALRRALAGHDELRHWREVDHPRDGDAILMGRSARPCHVGVWADDGFGGVLHSVEGAGVIFSPRASLPGLGYRVTAILRRLG
jgi:cell wall-associated NlpC family hydrolase